MTYDAEKIGRELAHDCTPYQEAHPDDERACIDALRAAYEAGLAERLHETTRALLAAMRAWETRAIGLGDPLWTARGDAIDAWHDAGCPDAGAGGAP